MICSIVHRIRHLFKNYVVLSSASKVVAQLKLVRNKALTNDRHITDETLKIEVELIRGFLSRKVLFRKTSKDLVELVTFCGHSEFTGHEILSAVLLNAFTNHRKFFLCYKMCVPILGTHQNVLHYLSTCNAHRLHIGKVRFTEFLLDWLVKLFSIRKDLLALLDVKILQEILRRGTTELYDKEFYDVKFWEIDNDSGITPFLIADLLYLCLAALYTIQLHGSNDEASVQSKAFLNILACMSVLLRAAPRIPLMLLHARAQVIHYYTPRDIIDRTVRTLQSTRNFSVLSNFQERLGFKVSSLKHLSRCKIRSQLYSNWSLPEGLKALVLPQNLLEYLDLEYD